MLQYLRELTEKALASEVFAVRTALAPGELDGQGFRMRTGERLPISRTHLHRVRDAFFGYLQEIT